MRLHVGQLERTNELEEVGSGQRTHSHLVGARDILLELEVTLLEDMAWPIVLWESKDERQKSAL